MKLFTYQQFASKRTFFICLVAAFTGVPTGKAQAQGDLLIMPKRIVLEGGKRSENLNLANIGNDTATYVISFVHVKMNEDGTIENITEPEVGQPFADKNLRIFPRMVTLGPKESQVVKVQVSKTGDLANGEYRSNIYFRAVPKEMPLGENDPKKKDSSFSVKIIPIFGISIPAIIRIGEPNVKVDIANVSLDLNSDTVPVVTFSFIRSGNMSAYGDINIDHISPYGKATRVANMKGVAVYNPNSKRIMRIKLDRRAGADFTSGKLKINYVDQSGKNSIIAQNEIQVK